MIKIEGDELRFAVAALEQTGQEESAMIATLRGAHQNEIPVRLTEDARATLRTAVEASVNAGAFDAAAMPAVRAMFATKLMPGTKSEGRPVWILDAATR